MDISELSHQAPESHTDRWRPVIYQEGEASTKALPSTVPTRQTRQLPLSLYDNDAMDVVDEDDPSPPSQPPALQHSLIRNSINSSNSGNADHQISRSPGKFSSVSSATRGQKQATSPKRGSWSTASPRKILMDENINKSPPRGKIVCFPSQMLLACSCSNWEVQFIAYIV